MNKEVIVDANELLAAAKFCDRKENKGVREILRCVHVEANKEEYALVSTDSYKLIKFVHNRPVDDSDEFTVNIGIDIIKDAVKSSDELVSVVYDDETGDITMHIYKRRYVERTTVTTRANDNEYPNYRKLLEVEPEVDDDGNELPRVSDICLNTVFLTDICNAINLAYGKKNAKVDFELGTSSAKQVMFHRANEFLCDNDGKRKPVVYCDGIIMPIRK